MTEGSILVIDDEPRILDIVRYFLELGGYQVEGYTSATEGVEAARRRPFDVAVLDIVLGDTSGYDVAGRLKSEPLNEKTPVLFISSRVEMDDLFLSSYDGLAEFLQKPFKKEALLARVAGLKAGGGQRAVKRGADA